MDISLDLDYTKPMVYVIEYQVDFDKHKMYSFDKNKIMSFANSKAYLFVQEGFEEVPIIPDQPNILFKGRYECEGECVRKIKIKEISCLRGNQKGVDEEQIYLYSIQTHIRGSEKIEAYSTSSDLIYKTKEEMNKRFLKDRTYLWSKSTPFGRHVCHVAVVDKLGHDKDDPQTLISFACTKLEGCYTDEETNPRYWVVLSIVKILEEKNQ